MNKVDDIKSGREIGRLARTRKFQWLTCPDCKRERWVAIYKGKPVSMRCNVCNGRRLNLGSGADSRGWKGGQSISHGYPMTYVNPDDFFHQMADKRHYVLDHRLVMAKHLGRNLHSWEIVHHKNHIKDDNRIENLQLVSSDGHKQISILEQKIERLQKENKALRDKLKCRPWYPHCVG